MKTLTRLLAIAAVAAMILAVTQRTRIGAARADLARLEAAASVPAGKPARARGDSATPEEIARLRAANREIYKLRGEISQAREKRRSLERMEAENAQFREKIARLKANPDAAKPQPSAFSNKGQSTPEAAVETTFWSMHQGDLETLSRLMPMATAELERMPAEEKTNNLTMLRAMAAMIEKLEFTELKYESSDEALLGVRFTPRAGSPGLAGREQTTFVLRRTNNVWQIVRER